MNTLESSVMSTAQISVRLLLQPVMIGLVAVFVCLKWREAVNDEVRCLASQRERKRGQGKKEMLVSNEA